MIEHLAKYATDFIQAGSILLSSVMQFALGGHVGWRAFVIVLGSAFLLAYFILRPILNDIGTASLPYFGDTNLHSSSGFGSGLLVVSALLSHEVVNFIVTKLPLILQKKVLGEKDDIKKQG